MADKQKAEGIIKKIDSNVNNSNDALRAILPFVDELAQQLNELSGLLDSAELTEEEKTRLWQQVQNKVGPLKRNFLILASKLEEESELVDDLPQLAAREVTGEGTIFSDFLSNIGASVIQSQQKLDEQSLIYLAGIKDRQYIPPSLFRIPKISAELKVALSDEKEKGINVLLFSEKRKMNFLNQQSLKFDIVAVPPSPDLLKAAYEHIPRIDFVFDRTERRRVFNRIGELLGTIENEKVRKQIQELFDENRHDQVVIWQLDPSPQYLLLYADPDADPESGLGVWHFDAQKGQIDAVIRSDLKPKPGETQRPLWTFFTKLANDQRALLI